MGVSRETRARDHELYTRRYEVQRCTLLSPRPPLPPSPPRLSTTAPAAREPHPRCQAMNTDMGRLSREFYTPEPISQTGNYYPRYKVTGNMETGSCHVSYLAKPYYFYNVPSRYGFSKYVTVQKLGVW